MPAVLRADDRDGVKLSSAADKEYNDIPRGQRGHIASRQARERPPFWCRRHMLAVHGSGVVALLIRLDLIRIFVLVVRAHG